MPVFSGDEIRAIHKSAYEAGHRDAVALVWACDRELHNDFIAVADGQSKLEIQRARTILHATFQHLKPNRGQNDLSLEDIVIRAEDLAVRYYRYLPKVPGSVAALSLVIQAFCYLIRHYGLVDEGGVVRLVSDVEHQELLRLAISLSALLGPLTGPVADQMQRVA